MFVRLTNMIFPIITQVPLPRDIELPLPLDEGYLKFLLVALFLVHILFVNLMVGGSLLSVIFEMFGLNSPKYDRLGHKIAETITVNKSLAVVLGVGPLLCINLVYTLHFYSANSLTGYAWISIIPLVTMAFLLAYLHKFTWDRWTGDNKKFHILVGVAATSLFLSIPLIFLANINLMLFPEKWLEVGGFFSSLLVGNVFPRYFHFLTATIALTGLFLTWWMGRKKYPVEKYLPEFTHASLRRIFYRVAFFATLAQLAFGPLLLFTLPYRGMTTALIILVLIVIVLAVIVLFLFRIELRRKDETIGRSFVIIVLMLTAVVGIMGTARHLYREASLAEHYRLIADETARFKTILAATEMRLAAGLGAGDAISSGPTGESVFANCAACHALNKVLAAPSLREIYSIYKDNPDGIVAWAKVPGKKRPQFAPMPSFTHLGDEKLRLAADYILQLAGSENTANEAK